MQLFTLKNRILFVGSARELRNFLRTLPTDMSLREFIHARLH